MRPDYKQQSRESIKEQIRKDYLLFFFKKEKEKKKFNQIQEWQKHHYRSSWKAVIPIE